MNTNRVWGLLSVSLLCPIFAVAQESQTDAVLEEVIVTATKREQSILDVPFSVNALTIDEIRRSGAASLEDLSRNVAGLSLQNLGPGQSQVAIRGVSAGQIVRDQPGVKEQVGVYLDESVISLSLFTPDFDLFDLNRVETLRGPQGTLFGSGSIGGTIRYITQQPNLSKFESTVEVNLNTVTDGDTGGHLKGMVNIPLSEGRAALRLVGYATEYAGFIDATREGGGVREDVNGGSRRGGRIALSFAPTETLTITPRVIYQEIETDGFNRQEVFNLYANPFTTTRPPVVQPERTQHLLLDEQFTDETLIADVVVGAELGPVDLTFVSSYTDRSILVSRDASALTGSVSIDLGYPTAGVLLPSNLRDTTELEQMTHELRFASNGDGRLQWVAGVFYSDTNREYAQRLPTPGYAAVTDATLGMGTSAAVANGFPNLDSPFNSDLPYDIEQIAVFGEATFDMTDRFALTVGGRFYDFEEQRSITTGGLFANGDNQSDTTESDGFTPRVLARFKLNDRLTLNAGAAQGFRLGGVNDPLLATLCTPADRAIFGGFQSYEDETMWNYEVGLKSRFDNGLTMSAAAFYADITDLQVTLDAGSCSSRISFNVPEAHSAGLEFELSGRLAESFGLSIAASYAQSEFDTTVVDGMGAVIGGIAKGNRLASVPEFQATAAGTYYFPLAWGGGDTEGYVSAALQHVGDRITQPSDQLAGAGNFTSRLPFGGATGTAVTSLDLELDAYTLFNLSAGVVRNNWEAILYVQNVTDENVNLAFDRERGGRARLGFATNSPRTIGLTFRMNFGE
jgi:iron complex outermembrane recepter protein